jgi:OmcA/MtrC family decaheme c-type cytochrome
MKKMSLRPWIALVGAGLLATVIAGCGGDDGKDGAPGAPGAPGDTGPAGPPGPSADAPIFNSNNTPPTEAQAAAWAALAPQISNISVTIASPPVVTFTVKDAYGRPVLGLGSTSQSQTATVGSLANISFTLAKLVPGRSVTSGGKTYNTEPSKWVSYLVTRVPTTTQVTCPSGQTTCDYTKLIASTASCNATATSPATWCGIYPTLDREGTLKDNGDGTYTYTFYRDPQQAASIVAGLTDSADGLSKKADLGDLTYDATLTHRLGIQIGGNAPGTGSNTPNATTLTPGVAMANPANAWYDFVPAGGDVTTTRQVVQLDSCSSCHDGKVLAHGQRKDPNYCVTCHTDQIKYSFNGGEAPMLADGITFQVQAKNPPVSTDNATVRPKQAILGGRAVGNYPNMIHKTHMGEELVKQGYTFNNATEGFYNTFAFPQDPANCTKCHNGTTTTDPLVAKVTPNGDNWKNNPSMLACGACHDGIDFATGKGITLADKAAGVINVANGSGHLGGPQADNVACNICHNADTIPLSHQRTVASPNNPTVKGGGPSFAYNIPKDGATLNASAQVVVKFQILMDGKPVALNPAPATTPLTGFTGSPNFIVVYATGQDGIAAPSDWNSRHDSLSLLDAINGANGNVLTVADAATNTYQVTIAASTATSSRASHTLAVPSDAKMVTVFLKDSFTDSTLVPRPGIPAMATVTGNTPDGKPNVARRVIFSESKCNSCHDRLGTSPSIHNGNYSIAMCAACHTPNQGGSTGWSASFRVWVHGIHSAEKRTVPFTWHGTATDNFSFVGYPGVLKDCTQCHNTGTYDFSASQYTDALIGSMLNVQAATGTGILSTSIVPPQLAPIGSGQLAYGLVSGQDYGAGWDIDQTTGKLVAATTQGNNLVSSPITAVCSTCHDTSSATAHMESNGGSFYTPRSTALNNKEACLTCHGPGKFMAIADVHK